MESVFFSLHTLQVFYICMKNNECKVDVKNVYYLC